MTGTYASFLCRKSQLDGDFGFEPTYVPDQLFDFQKSMVEWACRKGRAALFEDCGLGKSFQELVWSENVVRKTNGRVLLLTPIAVGTQMIGEAEKFGIEARRADKLGGPGIYVTNYEKLHRFDPADFVGVVGDESGILKNFEGRTRAAVTEFMRPVEYRLLGTATAAPNDYVELGTSSEALGYLGHMDMLAKFFVNNRNTSDTKRKWASHGGGNPLWRFKGHAERPFWQWTCSWARALRKPSDLGFDDARFELPPLLEREHVVGSSKLRAGCLFHVPAHGLSEQRAERKRTLKERCEKVAELVNGTGHPAVSWCHTNDEGDLLERLIPDAVQVSGRDSDEAKEEKFQAFISGQTRVLVTKHVIGAWGLNLQHCAHTTMFADYSFEQAYQSLRRFWRFGQKRPVTVDYIASDGQSEVLESRQRKAAQAETMFSELVRYMREGMSVERGKYGDKQEVIPAWLSSIR